MKSPRFYVLTIALLLCLTGFTFNTTSKSLNPQENKTIRITNRTRTFQLTDARLVDNQLHLSFTNNDDRRVTAWVITFGTGHRYSITEDYFVSEESDEPGIKPRQTLQRTFPLASSQLNSTGVVLEAAVFDDKTGDGNPVNFEDIIDDRLGRALQIKRSLKLLDQYVDSLDGRDSVGKLKAELEVDLSRPEAETLVALKELQVVSMINRSNRISISDSVHEGLAAGRTDVLRRVAELENCKDRKDKLLSIKTHYYKLLGRL